MRDHDPKTVSIHDKYFWHIQIDGYDSFTREDMYQAMAPSLRAGLEAALAERDGS